MSNVIDVDSFNNDLLRSKLLRKKLSEEKRRMRSFGAAPNFGKAMTLPARHRAERIENILEMSRGGKLKRYKRPGLRNRQTKTAREYPGVPSW